MKFLLIAALLLFVSAPAFACELSELSDKKYIAIAKNELKKIKEHLDPSVKPTVSCNKHIVTVKFGAEPPKGAIDGNPPTVTIDIHDNKVLSVSRGCC
jgi:hypothetical protein